MDDSDKIRCYVMNAALRRVFRRSGYFVVKSAIDLTVKVTRCRSRRDFRFGRSMALHARDGELDGYQFLVADFRFRGR